MVLIKLWWTEISKVISIKISPFCFLEAQDITAALHKIASDGVPFSFRIEPLMFQLKTFYCLTLFIVNHRLGHHRAHRHA